MGSTRDRVLTGRRARLVDRKLVEGVPSECRLAASVWIRPIGGYTEAEWPEYRLVEAPARLEVRDANIHVMKHSHAHVGGIPGSTAREPRASPPVQPPSSLNSRTDR